MGSVMDKDGNKYDENNAEEELKAKHPGCTVEIDNYHFIVKNGKGEVKDDAGPAA